MIGMPYKDPEKQKAYLKQYNKKYKRKDGEHRKDYMRDFMKNYIPKHRNTRNEYNRKYIRKLHDKVIDLLGGKCTRCGITDKRVLQVNHMNGGGCKEFKKIGALVLYNQILKGKRATDDLEVRCSNCNIIYRWRNQDRITEP
jgi:hypothetical protein